MSKHLFSILFGFMVLCVSPVYALQTWETTPPIPALPKAETSGYAPINGVKIWYAIYGHGQPVLLLHGGLADSNSWGKQVPALAKSYRVIVMDTRGHGRSTNNGTPYSYDQMSLDALALLNHLHIQRTAIVGWSDGAIVGLDLAIHHPERLNGIFVFGANSDPSGTKDVSHSPVMNTYIHKIDAAEYERVSPTPKQYAEFEQAIVTMWQTQPHFSKQALQSIHVPIWIVDGDRDEGITRQHTEYMADTIPNAGLLLLPEVGHFAQLQDAEQFNNAVLRFLQKVYPNKTA